MKNKTKYILIPYLLFFYDTYLGTFLSTINKQDMR